jgi:hypothetical protein
VLHSGHRGDRSVQVTTPRNPLRGLSVEAADLDIGGAT